ncbi:MAG: hypothetical protein U5L76_00550 [Patescibacteria group bacterium]|nr:hypothetical protein [Patescibacteria group bacterium]
MITKIGITLAGLWICLGIIFPYIIFPNYLIKPKIKSSNGIRKVAKKLKSKNKEKTIRNVYDFLIKQYEGHRKIISINSLKQLFKYNVDELLKNKQFLWCHSQNLILKTLLINTGHFKENDIRIKWTITKRLTIHQYIEIRKNNSLYKLDPFYEQFRGF